MTVIIGLEHEGKVWMGGDSASTSGYHQRRLADPKIFVASDILFGGTGSSRISQIMQYHFSVREQLPSEDDHAYLITLVVPEMRSVLLLHGAMGKDEGRDDGYNSFLMGYRGKLYSFFSDFQLNRYDDGFDAVGAGREYAVGAMGASAHLEPKKRIKQALEITALWNTTVCSPFHIESI